MSNHYRNGCLLGLFCAVLICAAGCESRMEDPSRGSILAGPAAGGVVDEAGGSAETSSGPAPVVEEPAVSPRADAGPKQRADATDEPIWLQSLKVDHIRFRGKVIEGFGDTFLRADNISALLLAGGASVYMHNEGCDDSIQDNVRHDRFFNHFWDNALNVTGHPGLHFGATGLWYGLSADSQDDLNKERALTMLTALSVTGIVTTGLKAARDNESPNGEPWAWPSGHTSSSFTVASVLDEFYGPKVGIPAYILASLVAYRMVDTDGHWTSDVIFGATLGWMVGHTIAGKDKQLEIAGYKVLPYVGSAVEPAIGVTLFKRF